MYKSLTILLLFVSQFTLGQNDNVILSIEPHKADVGEMVIIRIKTKVHGEVEIDNLPSCFIPGLDFSSEMQSEIDHNTGNIITYYRLSRTGAFGKAGKYTIGPAFVTKGHKTYKSNTVELTIGAKTRMTPGEITAQQLNDPAFGIIQTNKTTIYEGEPLFVSAKVYSHFNPTYMDKYLPYSMQGAIDKHPVGNSLNPQTSRERFKGLDLFTFEYDKNVIFPVGTGHFNLNSYKMTLYQGFQSFSLLSSSADITIKPLPENPPADFIGAVGEFNIEREIESHKLKQGDVFTMRIIVSGIGNLQNILEPRPKLPKGFIIYGDPQVEENFVYTSQGTDGEISYEYNVQVSNHGELTLPATSISYFDIGTEQYVTISTNEEPLRIEKDKNFVVEEVDNQDTQPVEELDLHASLRKSSIKTDSDSLYGTTAFWVGFGTPLMTAILFLFFAKRREQSQEEIATRQIIKRKDLELSESIAQLKVLLVSQDNNAFYSKIEQTLKTAIELEMQTDSDRILTKQDIISHLENTERKEIADRVNSLLSKCDQYRFGFAADNTSNQELYTELESILSLLRS